MSRRRIDAVGVLVPAHDEGDLVGPCVRSVLAALAVAGRPAAVCVLADRCTDATVRRARAAVSGAALPAVVHEDRSGGTIGALRNRAAEAALARLDADPERTWLLSTDADGTVDPGWVRAHLDPAAAGADAVAGGVALDLPGRPAPPGEPPLPDHPVYGANLGLRAGPFLSVGGFPDIACGEDHGIVARLRAAGYRVAHGAPGTVCTSARTTGRARDGLADLLGSPVRADQRVGA